MVALGAQRPEGNGSPAAAIEQVKQVQGRFFRNSVVSALFCLVEKQGVIATSNFPAGGDRYAEALPDAHFGIGQMFGAD